MALFRFCQHDRRRGLESYGAIENVQRHYFRKAQQ